MSVYRFEASRQIAAPAALVYGIIADYENGHPHILPQPYFEGLRVDEGGVGAGTKITFQARLMGQRQTMRAVISEPEPGRVLVETDPDRGAVTTFTVDPRENGQQAWVTISTALNVSGGPLGRLKGWLAARMLRPVYVKELAQLAHVAAQRGARSGARSGASR